MIGAWVLIMVFAGTSMFATPIYFYTDKSCIEAKQVVKNWWYVRNAECFYRGE